MSSTTGVGQAGQHVTFPWLQHRRSDYESEMIATVAIKIWQQVKYISSLKLYSSLLCLFYDSFRIPLMQHIKNIGNRLQTYWAFFQSWPTIHKLFNLLALLTFLFLHYYYFILSLYYFFLFSIHSPLLSSHFLKTLKLYNSVPKTIPDPLSFLDNIHFS